jgi:hypothetical protein
MIGQDFLDRIKRQHLDVPSRAASSCENGHKETWYERSNGKISQNSSPIAPVAAQQEAICY